MSREHGDRRRHRRPQAAARTTDVAPYVRKRPARQPFPEHLPRERVVEPATAACHGCGGHRLRKLGEDITETLEVVPRQWKVIQHVREKFTCRGYKAISQAPAPFQATPPGRARPGLLAIADIDIVPTWSWFSRSRSAFGAFSKRRQADQVG